jgi:hypothetical protein
MNNSSVINHNHDMTASILWCYNILDKNKNIQLVNNIDYIDLINKNTFFEELDCITY